MENNKLRQEIEKVSAWIESAKFHMDRGYNQATIIDKIEHADKAMAELKKFIGFNVPVSGNEANHKNKQSGEVAFAFCEHCNTRKKCKRDLGRCYIDWKAGK